MDTSRREFMTIGFAAGTGLLLGGCSKEEVLPTAPSKPTPTPTTPTPTPQRPAEIIAAPPTYVFAVKTNIAFANVFAAFSAANASYDTASTLNGLKVTKIGTIIDPSWKIDINGAPFCSAAGLASVPAGATIACYIEDHRKIQGTCISDRPA